MPLRKANPKHLEKILYLNHKEDLVLEDRLDELKKVSRNRLMAMDLESNMVRKELRNSRKKNLTINEAIAAGLLPTPDMLCAPAPSKRKSQHFLPPSPCDKMMSTPQTRLTASAPAHRNTIERENRPGFSRSGSYSQRPGQQRRVGTANNQCSRPPPIIEVNESPIYDRNIPMDSIGAYVLDEFEKISQVVPDILRALAKKKEQQKEKEEAAAALRNLMMAEKGMGDNIIDYEPDMNKVRKTVRSVKKLRHRMAISKKLETNKPNKSLAQMIKDRTESFGEYDEYTDGTCSLMKRRLEKKRRESSPHGSESQLPSRRQSAIQDFSDNFRGSSFGGIDRRRSTSMFSLPGTMSRSNTMFDFGSPFKRDTFSGDGEDGTQMIDEDTLMNRQKIFKEFQKYQVIQNKIDTFLFPGQGNSNLITTVIEEVVPLQ